MSYWQPNGTGVSRVKGKAGDKAMNASADKTAMTRENAGDSEC
jgi:hypothetical protein